MLKLVGTIFAFALSGALGILVLIHGWGLKPVDWSWIIGGMIFQFMLYIIVATISKE